MAKMDFLRGKYVGSECIWKLKFRLHIHNIIIIITFISVSGDVQICESVWCALCGGGGGGCASRLLARGKPEKRTNSILLFQTIQPVRFTALFLLMLFQNAILLDP